jgi:hypothetical protein
MNNSSIHVQSSEDLLKELNKANLLHERAIDTAMTMLASNCELMMARDAWKSKAEYYKGLIDAMPAESPARVEKARGK